MAGSPKRGDAELRDYSPAPASPAARRIGCTCILVRGATEVEGVEGLELDGSNEFTVLHPACPVHAGEWLETLLSPDPQRGQS